MSGNTFRISAGKELGAIISQMALLKVARSIEEVPEVISSICNGLMHCKQPIEFDFSHNAFGTRVAPILSSFLSQHVSLQVLKLNNNGFSPEAGNVVAQALLGIVKHGEAIGRPASLRVLLLTKNRLEDASADLWGEVLAAHKDLQKVKFHISKEDRGKRGWHFVAEIVRSCHALEFLDLSDSGLTEDGCTELGQALEDIPHPHLHTILMENNDMGRLHYQALNKILETNLPNLKLLDLALNEGLDDNSEEIVGLIDCLKDRGGKVLIDDPEDEDSTNHIPDVHSDASDTKKEVRLINLPSYEAKEAKESVTNPVVDALADIVSTGLKIDDVNLISNNPD
ncbi:hypothetical protein C0989_002467 [Termitomyces sp. Mn162]|nr:hypothetical protein C0989_002467 [Termitomyces sp. Mn162]